MNRKRIFLVSTLILAIVVGGTALSAATLPVPVASGIQTVSTDIEVLNDARDIGVFTTIPPGNFTAGFAFSPGKGFVQVNTLLLTLIWDPRSQGHVGDVLSIQLNGQSPTSFSMNVQDTKLLSLNQGTLRVGANSIDIGVTPLNPFATAADTDYRLFEVRLTVEYAVIG